ncbi:MAG TPA: glycyl-radical enzyme activating protein [Candidatus Brocadiia bacterium]|nr:glycyl-radical enzyme activating protein [Candidatus Brocadiales bacterium]
MAITKEKKPLIFDIKRNSLEDGPGIRSMVFFKGCPLRCIFCHNPESQETVVEIAFSAKDCIRCGNCEKACPEKAINLDNPAHIDRDKCNRCEECVKVCPGNGLRAVGSYYEVEALTEILMRDAAFYRHSGGGVTLSGGECTIYPDYLECLLKLLKANGIHTVLETAGYFEYDTFKQKVLPYIDLIYYDIKIADADAHTRFIGVSNQKILDNLRSLLKENGVEVLPRVPLIPGITATHENFSAIIDFLCDAGADKVSLLPYNPMGFEMLINLGKQKPPLPERFMKPEEEKEVRAMFKEIILQTRAK